MNPYVTDIKILKRNHLTYMSQRKYLSNEVNISFIFIVFLILISLTLYMVALIASLIFLNLSPFLTFCIYIGIPLLVLGVWLYDSIEQHEKMIPVNLFVDQDQNVVSIRSDGKIKEVKFAQAIRMSIQYYPRYKKNGVAHPIILLSLDILGDHMVLNTKQHELRLASMQCKDIQEAQQLFNGFLDSYQVIINWLNLPVQEEKNIIMHSRFWYLS